MYGKHFESMYHGSMYGAGLAVFAVWGWVISNARCGAVEINPKLLADVLGGDEEEVRKAVEWLCRPDPESRFKGEEGRRLVKEGQYQYRLPSWEEYQRVRSESDRREYNRVKQREYREAKRAKNPDGIKRRAKGPAVGFNTLEERVAIERGEV